MSQTFTIIAIVGFSLAVILLIVAVIMYFVLQIKRVRNDLTGKTAARSIAEIRSRSKTRKRPASATAKHYGWEKESYSTDELRAKTAGNQKQPNAIEAEYVVNEEDVVTTALDADEELKTSILEIEEEISTTMLSEATELTTTILDIDEETSTTILQSNIEGPRNSQVTKAQQESLDEDEAKTTSLIVGDSANTSEGDTK